MDAAAAKQLALGRMVALKIAPYYSQVLYGLIPVEVQDTETAFVTPGLVMGYNPEWVRKLTVEETGGLLAHEVNHVLRESAQRAKDMEDKSLANLAADIPINDDMLRMGFRLPACGVTSTNMHLPPGKTMEEYYMLLQQRQQQGRPPQSSGGGGATGGGCGGIAGNPGNPELEAELDKMYGRATIDVKNRVSNTLKTIQRVQQGRGNLSADLADVIQAANTPVRIPWRSKLAHILQSSVGVAIAGASDYSCARPSSRAFAYDDDIVRPGLVSYDPVVGVCVDTSGSMGNDQIAKCFRSILDVLRELNLRDLLYMEADADVCAIKRMTSVQLRSVEIHGRGGTDFRPAFSAMMKQKPRPQVVIYFTDGDGTLPDTPPTGFHTIWCVVPSRWGSHPFSPGWGDIVYMKDLPEGDTE